MRINMMALAALIFMRLFCVKVNASPVPVDKQFGSESFGTSFAEDDIVRFERFQMNAGW